MYAGELKQALRGKCTGMGTDVMGTGTDEMGMGWGETCGDGENKLSLCSSLPRSSSSWP